jgi:hypothetical protein
MSLLVPVQAALTAAVVTLLIDYGLKPRLEVRKDRAVRSSQLNQDLLTGLQMLRFGAHQLIPLIDHGKHTELSNKAATLQHQATELLEKTRRLQGSLERIRGIEVVAGLVLVHCCFSYVPELTETTMDADKIHDALYHELGEIDQQIVNSLSALSGRSRKRWRVVRRARVFISGPRRWHESAKHNAATVGRASTPAGPPSP